MHPAHTKRKETRMKIELGTANHKLGALRLGPHQTLKVVDGAGSTVCAVEGSVWITEENQRRDIVLERGACYRLRERGLALINALGGEAALSFT
jgi:hypothetical protein